jgi:hypothetical protein
MPLSRQAYMYQTTNITFLQTCGLAACNVRPKPTKKKHCLEYCFAQHPEAFCFNITAALVSEKPEMQ